MTSGRRALARRPPVCPVSSSPGLRYLDDYHAPVLRAPRGGAVVGGRLALAKALGGDAARGDSLRNEIRLHRVRSALRKRLIVRIGPDVVGVALNLGVGLRVLLQERHGLPKRVLGGLGERGLVEREVRAAHG